MIIGAGISGLAAAWTLSGRRPDAEVLVLEAGPTVGGKLRVAEVAGVQVDVGAEAMLARRPEGVGLAREAGLADAVIHPATTAARIRVGGAAHPLPARTLMGIPTDLEAARVSGALTDDALKRVAAEPTREPLPPIDGDVAVGALVRDRLGDEVVDRLVEPLLGGVYAGRADALSLEATVPALAARLRDGGSLVSAARAITDVGTHDPSAGPVFASLAGGLGRLPEALRKSGRFAVRTGVTVRRITRSDKGFLLETGPVPRAERLDADAVIVATPAVKTSRLLADVAPTAARELAAVEAASMAIVTLAFRDVTPPPGSGLLIGIREGFAVKAITLSSQKWPITSDGLVILRASIGRAGEARDLQRDDADLIDLVRRELPALAGIDATPIDALVTRWGGGLPQYGVGHVERVARIRAAVGETAGLAVCGATYDGVGIPACVASAHAAVDRVLAGVEQDGQWVP